MKLPERKGGDMVRVTWLYYIEQFTQNQIAEKLGVSRSTVIRLLQRARESGLVTISLGVSSKIFELERDLETLYGLETVRIVPKAEDGFAQRRWLGHVAAGILRKLVQKNSIVAVSWGRTLLAMANSLQGEISVPGVQTVALVGCLYNAERGTNPFEVAEIVGQFFGAPARALHAPIFVRDAATSAGLISDPGLTEALNMARCASLAAFSVGALTDDATMLRLGYLNAAERQFLERKGAVADIACRWVDAGGGPVELPPTIHPIGISLAELRRIPRRLMVAGGASKQRAIVAALLGGYATHLVTDEGVAAALIGGSPQTI